MSQDAHESHPAARRAPRPDDHESAAASLPANAHAARPPDRSAPSSARSKGEDLRRTGIEPVGAVPWGTHFCQFYETAQDLVDTLVPYFLAGLAANESCMWVTSEPLRVEEAAAALRVALPDLDRFLAQGQIEILDYTEWYTRSGKFDAATVLQGWMDKLAVARELGYEGLRLTGNTSWLDEVAWGDFRRYEGMVDDVMGRHRLLALCTYSLEKCDARGILDVISNHQFALIKGAGRWEIIESARYRKTELALRQSEQRLRLATEVAELGVFEWDALADRPVWENQRMFEIFGRDPRDGPLTKAQLMAEVIHPDDAGRFEAALAGVLRALRARRRPGLAAGDRRDAGRHRDPRPGRGTRQAQPDLEGTEHQQPGAPARRRRG